MRGGPQWVLGLPTVPERCGLAHMVHSIIQTLSHVWTKDQPQSQFRFRASFLRCRTFFNTIFFVLQETNGGGEREELRITTCKHSSNLPPPPSYWNTAS